MMVPFWKPFTSNPQSSQPDISRVKNILVLEYHCIGDVLLIASALDGLKNHFPDANITLVTNHSVAQLAERSQLAHRIVPVLPPWIGKLFSVTVWLTFLRVIGDLKRQTFDLGISFKGDFRDHLVLHRIHPKIRIGYNATGGDYSLTHAYSFPFEKHQVDRALTLLKHVQIPVENSQPRLQLDVSSFEDRNSGYMVFHPGASHPYRRWPEIHWVQLVKSFEQDADIVLVDTPDTQKVTRKISTQIPSIPIFQGSLESLAVLMQSASLVVGMDSMAVHLAVSVGTPALAIFGAQDDSLTRPYGPIGYVVKPPHPCRHKKPHWRLCPECMELVGPDSVRDMILSIANSLGA